MKLIARTFTILVALAVTLPSCIKEDSSDCDDKRVALRFVFTDHNDTEEPVDLFSDLVNDVDVYIFDENDRYVHNLSVRQSTLSNGNTLYIDLDEGEYKVVTWGNLNDPGYGVDTPEQTRNGYRISAATSRTDISDLFHGMTELAVVNGNETQEINLTRNTHIIRVHLLGLSGPARSAPGTDYSVRIEGSNHHYDFDNNPVAQSAATYIPTYTSLTENERFVVRADFKVQRLFTDKEMKLDIYKADVIDRTDNVTSRILATYPDIQTDLDLDRRYVYDLYYALDKDTGAWVFVGNNILDWEGPTMPGDL